jgi:hypothetical protein
VDGLGDNDWSDFDPAPKTWWAVYRNRTKWLFRNPAYGFDYYLLGMKWAPTEWTIKTFIETPELTYFFATGPGFNMYYHGPKGMYKFGWKAWNRSTQNPTLGRVWSAVTTPSIDYRIAVVFSPNPFKKK